MIDTVTLLTYMLTHGFGCADRLKLTVAQSKNKTQLEWKNVPPETHSLALVIKDSSTKHPRYYGVLYNLPADSHGVKFDQHKHVNNNYWGVNTWGEAKLHHLPLHEKHLSVSLYALDERFSKKRNVTGKWVESHLKGHVIAKSKQVI